MTKNLQEVCHVDSNPLIQFLSSSLDVQTAGFLATVFRNSRHKPEGRSGVSKKRCWLSLLKLPALSVPFYSHYFLYLQDEPYRPFYKRSL